MSTTVRIQNTYSDGHSSERTVELVDPDVDLGSLDDWFEDVVFPETGDGHHGADGSCYTATIVTTPDVELVGKTYEWSD